MNCEYTICAWKSRHYATYTYTLDWTIIHACTIRKSMPYCNNFHFYIFEGHKACWWVNEWCSDLSPANGQMFTKFEEVFVLKMFSQPLCWFTVKDEVLPSYCRTLNFFLNFFSSFKLNLLRTNISTTFWVQNEKVKSVYLPVV
jgi:hypothetical protein